MSPDEERYMLRLVRALFRTYDARWINYHHMAVYEGSPGPDADPAAMLPLGGIQAILAWAEGLFEWPVEPHQA